MGTGLGLIHVAPYKECPIDFIPVDMATNALVGITWDLTERWYESD